MAKAKRSIQHVCRAPAIQRRRNVQLRVSPTTRLRCQRTEARTALNGRLEKPIQKYQMFVEVNSKPKDFVIYMDWSGWGFTVKQGGRTVHNDSGAYRVTTSSLTIETEAVTHARQWLGSQHDAKITHAIILRLDEHDAKG